MICDLHSDLLMDLVRWRQHGEDDAFRARHLPALQAAGIRVQVLATFVETAYVPEAALRRTLAMVEEAHRSAEGSDGALRIVTTAAELDAALADGAIAGVLGMEGVEALGRDPGLLGTFWRLGVRSVGLTWNRANDLADGLTEDRGAGITPLGRKALALMEERGMALDLAHLGPRGVDDVLGGAFGGRILLSHANAASVYATPRNASDDLLRELAARDGVLGLCAQRAFLGPGAAPERLVAHHAHVASIDPRLPVWGADFTSYLPPGPPEPAGLGLPPGTDLSLNELPEPDRETIYAEVDVEVRAAAGDGAADALAHGNALRFLRSLLG